MQRDAALQAVRLLRQRGHQALWAGGCVRDLLLGRSPADYDVATSATPDEVMRIFPETYAVGARFGVVLVPLKVLGNGDERGHVPGHVLNTSPATSRSQPFAPTEPISTGAIPTRCATPPRRGMT